MYKRCIQAAPAILRIFCAHAFPVAALDIVPAVLLCATWFPQDLIQESHCAMEQLSFHHVGWSFHQIKTTQIKLGLKCRSHCAIITHVFLQPAYEYPALHLGSTHTALHSEANHTWQGSWLQSKVARGQLLQRGRQIASSLSSAEVIHIL